MIRTLRRMIASVSLAALVASFALVAPAQAGTFSDVPADHWAYNAVESLTAKGVFVKRAEFFPGSPVNRAQVAKIVMEATGAEKATPTGTVFPDVAATDWFAPYVEGGVKLGLFSGYPDGTFKPERTMNRAEASKVIQKAFGFVKNTSGSPFTDVSSSDWFYEPVLTLYNNGVVKGKGVGTFKPGDLLNRGEMAVMIYRAMNPTTPTSTATPTASPTTTPTSTPTPSSKAGLSVSVSSKNPAGATIPKDANGVPLFALDFTAGPEDDVMLDSLMFKRSGVGQPSDFDNVYLYNGPNGTLRETSGRTISTDEHTVEFSNLKFKIQKGQTRTLWMRGDVASGASSGNESMFSVLGAAQVGSNAASVNASFPLKGNTMKIGGASSGSLTIEKSGTPATPKIGETQATIAKFKVDASGEDIAVQSMALIQNGSINRSDVSNLTLWQGSTKLAETASLDNDDLMQFDLGNKPYIVKDGNSKVFTVKADLGGKAGETTSVYIEEDSDILAIGQDFGFGVNVTRTGYDGGTASERTDLTLEGGQVTLAYSGPSAQNLSTDSKDQTFLKINMSAERNIEVKKLDVLVEALTTGTSGGDEDSDAGDLYDEGNSEPNIKDIRIVEMFDDGSRKTLMGPKELVSGSANDDSQTLNFTDSFNVKAGETKKLAITADIDDSAVAGDKFRFTLNAISTTAGIKDIDTNKFVTDIVPTAAIQGSTMTTQESKVEVSLASNPSTQTIVRGSSGVDLVGFNFKAGDASNIIVTDLTLTAVVNNGEGTSGAGPLSKTWSTGTETEDGSTASAANIIQSVGLYDGTTRISTLESPNTSTGSMTFTGLNWKVPAGETKSLLVKVDLGKNAKAGSYNDQVAVILTGASDVTAEDDEGDTITADVTVGSETVAPNTKGGTYTTASPNVFLIVAQTGTITVSAPADQVEDQTVIAGRDNVKLAKFKVKAIDENFTINTLTLDGLDGSAENKALKALKIKYPTNGATPTVLDGSSTVAIGATDTQVTFDGLNFAVPQDNDNVEFEVFANFQDIEEGSSDGAQSGTIVSVSWKATTSQDEFEATGDGSGDVISNSGSAITTGNATLRETVPTVTYVGSQGSIQFSSEADIVDLKITADSAGNVDVYQVELLVSANGLDTTTLTGAGGWSLFDADNLTSALDTATATLISGTSYRVTFTLSTPETVSSSGKTFRVRGPIAEDASDATQAILNVKISQDTTAGTSNTTTAATMAGTGNGGEAANNFVWSDRTAASHSTSTSDWANGYKLSIPTSFFTVR